MAKRVVVISSSPRKGGNSDTLCDEFVKGAVDADNAVVKYNLEEIRFHAFPWITYAMEFVFRIHSSNC